MITICQVGVAVLAIMALRSIAAKTVLSDTNAEDAQEIQVQFRTAASLMMALPFPLMMWVSWHYQCSASATYQW